MAATSVSNPYDLLRQVRPRTGFPVQNGGGIPRTGITSPVKPFVTQPTVEAGRPGPTGMVPTFPQTPATGPMYGLPRTPAGPYRMPTGTVTPTPAPAPAPAAPTAPAPTPASPSTSTSTTTASSGQTGVLSTPAQGDLESQIRDYISGAMRGSVSPEFIQGAKDSLFRTVGGQTAASTKRINDDAIRRGLARSGIPAEGIANVEAAGQGAMASGIADILNAAEQQNIQGRQAAAGTAGELLSANRSWQQYQDAKAEAAAARAAANQPSTFTYIDPETGQSYQMDEAWF